MQRAESREQRVVEIRLRVERVAIVRAERSRVESRE